MKVKPRLMAGAFSANHNQALVRTAKATKTLSPCPKAKTNLKAGRIAWNHNETLVPKGAKTRAQPAKTPCTRLKVRTTVKAGVTTGRFGLEVG